MRKSADGARLFTTSRPSVPTSVVLVVHGGSAESTRQTHWYDPGVLRMVPLARNLARRRPPTAVYRIRCADRGWNGSGATALRDTRWALAELRRAHPELPIVLVGHSMGARVSLHLGGDPGVTGLVLLTPWCVTGDPVGQLAGVPMVVIQAEGDRICPEPETRGYLAAAEVAGAQLRRTLLPGLGHGMVSKFWVWNRLSSEGIDTVVALSTAPRRIRDR